jgi:hypothetical protein
MGSSYKKMHTARGINYACSDHFGFSLHLLSSRWVLITHAHVTLSSNYNCSHHIRVPVTLAQNILGSNRSRWHHWVPLTTGHTSWFPLHLLLFLLLLTTSTRLILGLRLKEVPGHTEEKGLLYLKGQNCPERNIWRVKIIPPALELAEDKSE